MTKFETESHKETDKDQEKTVEQNGKGSSRRMKAEELKGAE